jgi:hypothetical protein
MNKRVTPPMIQRMPRCRQRGQSTVEFVVLALVLVPLLLIVPLIGKAMDMAQTTAVASRYVAFEGAARHGSSAAGWKTDAELAQEVRRRFFSNSDAPVKSKDTAGDFNAHRNSLWFDHRGQPLLTSFENSVGVATSKVALEQPFGAVFAGPLGLAKNNLYTGRVNVSMANVAGLQPWDALNLSIGRSTTLLVDPWAASGPAVIREKIRGDALIFPYQLLEVPAALIQAFRFPIEAPLGASTGTLPAADVGRVEPDRVPADRLAP